VPALARNRGRRFAAGPRRRAATRSRRERIYTRAVTFSWDPHKASANLKKHGVDFREAATVPDDALSTTFPDDEHSDAERRFVTIGKSAPGRVLVVIHTDTVDTIRIISARETTEPSRPPMKNDDRMRDDDMRPEYDFASMKGGVRGK